MRCSGIFVFLHNAYKYHEDARHFDRWQVLPEFRFPYDWSHSKHIRNSITPPPITCISVTGVDWICVYRAEISLLEVEEPHNVHECRLFPRRQPGSERAVPLSLLDVTTANFGLTSAIWLLERPCISLPSDGLAHHLRSSLSTALEAYPQWCGYLKAILSIDAENLPRETASFPAHAKRYSRVYVHYNTGTDPGAAFVEATSTATVDELYNAGAADGLHQTVPHREPLFATRGAVAL
jgi:hypothetical protein